MRRGEEHCARCPLDLGNQPLQDARQGEPQELLQEVRERVAQTVHVDDAGLTCLERLLEDCGSNSQQGSRVRGAAWHAPSAAAHIKE